MLTFVLQHLTAVVDTIVVAAVDTVVDAAVDAAVDTLLVLLLLMLLLVLLLLMTQLTLFSGSPSLPFEAVFFERLKERYYGLTRGMHKLG